MPTIIALIGQAGEQIRDRYLERACKAPERPDPDVGLATLDVPDHGPMNTRLVGQVDLREALADAQLPDSYPERVEVRVSLSIALPGHELDAMDLITGNRPVIDGISDIF